MKKEKRKLGNMITGYIMAFFCVTGWVALGVVLALTSVNIKVGGNIFFTAKEIYADISGRVTGTMTTNTLEDIHLNADTTNFTVPSSWSNITFDSKKGETMHFTITIKNKGLQYPIYVDFSDESNMNNVTLSMETSGVKINAEHIIHVLPSSTISIKFSFKLNADNAASGNFAMGINLSNKEIVREKSYYESQTYFISNIVDSERMQLQPCKNSGTSDEWYLNYPGLVYIPNLVADNGSSFYAELDQNYYGGAAYQNCADIYGAYVEVTEIPAYAFDGASALETVFISYKTQMITCNAFGNNANLSKIVIEKNIDNAVDGVNTGWLLLEDQSKFWTDEEMSDSSTVLDILSRYPDGRLVRVAS